MAADKRRTLPSERITIEVLLPYLASRVRPRRRGRRFSMLLLRWRLSRRLPPLVLHHPRVVTTARQDEQMEEDVKFGASRDLSEHSLQYQADRSYSEASFGKDKTAVRL